jgi:broad specificity phosphatase PhoE
VTLYPDASLQQIVLLRHGEPDLDKNSRRSYKQMKQFIYDYDTVRVKPIEQVPLIIDPSKVDLIHSSALMRAYNTSEQLYGHEIEISADSLFREFEREVVAFPILKLRPKTWGVWSRIFWVMGFKSNSIESFRQAKSRAKEIAEFLAEDANENQYSVLVSHGFLMRYVKKELIKNEWQLSYDGGNGYLGALILTKIER